MSRSTGEFRHLGDDELKARYHQCYAEWHDWPTDRLYEKVLKLRDEANDRGVGLD